ncbi:MAG TPA: DNA primase [Anaerolineaceae bacterium]
MTAVDEIKLRINLVDLVSESVQLRHSGKNYTGFCPFHHNTRTPAFVVFPDTNTWRCFGECNQGGDVFTYIMKKEGWDFSQALKFLAERAGVVLEPLTPEKEAEEEEYARLRALLEEAVTFYRHHLLQTPAGQGPLAYLKKRGLTQETIETFGLGYAPDAWEAASQYFLGKGYTQAELVAAGMVSERPSGGYYDRFRNRLMIPIRDPVGKMAGFGARIYDPNDQPKFLNSPQTVLFDKGRLLFGLDLARKAIRSKDQAVIVEGYLDVIALHQAGFNNAVSPMGTALTEDQVRLLKRFTRKMVLALDADAAGQKATLRGLEVARQAMDRTEELSFDARGLLRHEARLEADLRVTRLPEGKDPDDVVLNNPDDWVKIIESAQPVVIHVMETLAAGENLDDPKVKSAIAARVLPLIEDVPNPVERDTYRQRLARLLRVDERSLTGAGTAQPAAPVRRRTPEKQAQKKPTAPALPAARPSQGLETHCLRLLLRNPQSWYLLDRVLLKNGLARFSPQDFEQADHQTLARLIQRALEQEDQDPSLFIKENVPEPLLGLATLLNSPAPKPETGGEPPPEKVQEDLARSVILLRLARVNEGINQVRFLQEETASENQLAEGYQEMGIQYILLRQKLDRALRQPLTPD